MKLYSVILIILIQASLFSQNSIGTDSGHKDINYFFNQKTGDTALLIIGGIHGDEKESIAVAHFIKDNLTSKLPLYIIPELNPTLSSIEVSRRGYFTEHLDSRGYVKDGSDLTEYSKSLYYRIFYNNKSAYNNGIIHYTDPNRDFIKRVLPSTRNLIGFMDELGNKYKEVIVISLHCYMEGGRIYPEYSIDESSNYTIYTNVWKMVTVISEASGFKAEEIYAPALTILERFEGELIAYTGRIENLYGMDIELDLDNKSNSDQTIKGMEALITHLSKKTQ